MLHKVLLGNPKVTPFQQACQGGRVVGTVAYLLVLIF